MKCESTLEEEATVSTAACEIKLPTGLLGFEQIKHYLLIANPDEAPFRWLQVKDNPTLAFVVIDPFLVVPDYRPDIPQADVDFLRLSDPGDAQLYCIVTLHNGRGATINLKGPIVVNRLNGVGKQVVLANAAQYSVQHALPVADTAV
jgi:flagellar assembly factor FliW